VGMSSEADVTVAEAVSPFSSWGWIKKSECQSPSLVQLQTGINIEGSRKLCPMPLAIGETSRSFPTKQAADGRWSIWTSGMGLGPKDRWDYI
jgi:hypothetical protein